MRDSSPPPFRVKFLSPCLCRWRIGYRCYQSLTISDPLFPTRDGFHNPIEIEFTSSDLDPDVHTLAATRAAYLAHEQTWRRSSDCAALERQLADAAAHLVGHVDQIVAFGLGSLQRGNSGPEPRPRPHFQHAAMKTIAAFFGGRRKTTASSALKNDVKEVGFAVSTSAATAAGAAVDEEAQPGGVRCLIQDPWYSKIDKEFLGSMGFRVIDDPTGFLAVDGRSFVMCVAPDVPVKQIVADMRWPAGMLWNTVKPPDEDRTEWETEIFDGYPCSIA
jgi:hypothetical protein